MSQVEWVTLTGGYRPVMHFCLLSPCNCDGKLSGANVPRHRSPMAAQLWAEAFLPRGSQNEALSPAAVRVLEQTRIASSLVRLGQAEYDRLSQTQRPSSSPPPDPYAAWLA